MSTHKNKVNKSPKAKPEVKPTEEKQNAPQKFFVGSVNGVKYNINRETNAACRTVKTILCWEDEDISNDEARKQAIINEAYDELHEHGYCTDEDVALAEATFKAGAVLSKLAHELEYSDHGPCRNCTRNTVRSVENLLKCARDGYTRHLELCEKMNVRHGTVFPPDSELDKFTGKDEELVLKEAPKYDPSMAVDPDKISLKIVDGRTLPKELQQELIKFANEKKGK